MRRPGPTTRAYLRGSRRSGGAPPISAELSNLLNDYARAVTGLRRGLSGAAPEPALARLSAAARQAAEGERAAREAALQGVLGRIEQARAERAAGAEARESLEARIRALEGVDFRRPAAAAPAALPVSVVDTGTEGTPGAPVIANPGDREFGRGETISPFAVRAAGAGTVTVTVSGLPAGLTFAASTGLVSGTVSATAALQAYTVTITANDGVNPAVTDTFTITVSLETVYVCATIPATVENFRSPQLYVEQVLHPHRDTTISLPHDAAYTSFGWHRESRAPSWFGFIRGQFDRGPWRPRGALQRDPYRPPRPAPGRAWAPPLFDWGLGVLRTAGDVRWRMEFLDAGGRVLHEMEAAPGAEARWTFVFQDGLTRTSPRFNQTATYILDPEVVAAPSPIGSRYALRVELLRNYPLDDRTSEIARGELFFYLSGGRASSDWRVRVIRISVVARAAPAG